MAGHYQFKTSLLAKWALWLSRLAIPVVVLSFLFMRFGNMHPSLAVYCFASAIALALLSLLVSIFALPSIWIDGTKGGRKLWGAFLRGLVVLLPALVLAYLYFSRPAFSDLSTNPVDPPPFALAWSERRDADNSLEIHGLKSRKQQALAYPELESKEVGHPLELMHLLVRDLAEKEGWTILREERPGFDDVESYIEAKATSLITGLRYVVAIRLRDAVDEGTIIDMRSASLWGPHDLGRNASRIISFMDTIEKRLQDSIKRYELQLEEDQRRRRIEQGPMPRPKPVIRRQRPAQSF